MTKNDPFPIKGKYYGKPVGTIDQMYLLHCYDNGFTTPDLKKYIEENYEAKVLKDGFNPFDVPPNNFVS